MSQTQDLLNVLKREMRRHGQSYAGAAKVLELSEASVKRLFSENSFSLRRLETLCDWLGLDFYDLAQRMAQARRRVSRLTLEQEKQLAGNRKLMLMAITLMQHWTFEDIVQTYRISETEGIRLLARLDRLGIIQLLPGNRVKLMVSHNFEFIADGPIQKFFEERVQGEFFRSAFAQAGEKLQFVAGMLSEASNQEVQKRMEKLVMEFNLLSREDEQLPRSEREGTLLVVAMRPWQPQAFEDLLRDPRPD